MFTSHNEVKLERVLIRTNTSPSTDVLIPNSIIIFLNVVNSKKLFWNLKKIH